MACLVVSSSTPEKKLALVHRVLVPDKEYPKEFAILVTDRRSIFILQPKTRNSFVLRGEMRYGTALVTDVTPKTLEEYEETDLDSLEADTANLAVPHNRVISLVLTRGEPKFRLRDTLIWLTMRRQGHKFRVYDFTMKYRRAKDGESEIRFYLVPLGAYFKPRRQTQSRETILREYAIEALEIFRKVLATEIISAPQEQTP